MDIRITSTNKLQHNGLNSARYRNIPQELTGTAATDMTEWDWWAYADRTGAEVIQLDLRVGPAEEDVEADVREAVKTLLNDLIDQIIFAEEVAALGVVAQFVKQTNA